MQSLKEHFKNSQSNIFVNLIYNEWDKPDSTNRTQRRVNNVPMETLLQEYGNWIYECAYTTLKTVNRTELDVWAIATDERRYSEEYRNSKEHVQEEQER